MVIIFIKDDYNLGHLILILLTHSYYFQIFKLYCYLLYQMDEYMLFLIIQY